MSTTIRVQMNNNSYARALDLEIPAGAKAKHNGGKTVVVTLDEEDAPAFCQHLDENYKVSSYEQES